MAKGIEKLNFRVTGTRPLLMHNGQLSDPTNKFTQELAKVTKKRSKTEEDYAKSRELEWLGSLYLDEQGYVVIPSDYLLSAVIVGAKKRKLGTDAKIAVMDAAPHFQLRIGGKPRHYKDLLGDANYIDYRGVKIPSTRTRIMRTRPIFREWSVDVSFLLDVSVMDRGKAFESLETAGIISGFGDYRPRFGRFVVEKI